ncbi:hypothetical protein GPALN_003734 [Globodera pallida]|nr:hypothetical protein GPALN_003734 [Globodera pallida]
METFTKIGQWKQQNDVYQESVICDDKLWLFGKKFLDQPTFHWGHYAVFGGGMFDYFDLISGQWGQSQSFQPVSIKENRDEIVFVFGSRIFLLLFVNFGVFNVDSLHCFDMVKGEWNKIADFKKNNTISEDVFEDCASTNATQRNSLIIVKGSTPDGIYFISVSNSISVHFLTLSSNFEWKTIGVLQPEELNFTRLKPTHAALIYPIIFIQGGMEMCGFRWQATSLIKFNLENKLSTINEFGTTDDGLRLQRPTFSYSGPRASAISRDNKQWLHFTGTNAVGISGTTFNGQLWALTDLNSDRPMWTKLPLEVPETSPTNLLVNYRKATNELFVGAESLGGVLRAVLML